MLTVLAMLNSAILVTVGPATTDPNTATAAAAAAAAVYYVAMQASALMSLVVGR
jgi:hypothetical protein